MYFGKYFRRANKGEKSPCTYAVCAREIARSRGEKATRRAQMKNSSVGHDRAFTAFRARCRPRRTLLREGERDGEISLTRGLIGARNFIIAPRDRERGGSIYRGVSCVLDYAMAISCELFKHSSESAPRSKNIVLRPSVRAHTYTHTQFCIYVRINHSIDSLPLPLA